MKSICVFSSGTSEHALGHLRVCAPLLKSGVKIIWRRVTDDFEPLEIASCDLVVIQRDFPRNLTCYHQILSHASLHKKPIVFEIDDLLWDLPPNHPDRLNNHYLEALWPMLMATFQADAVIVSTPFLYEFLQSLTTAKVYQLSNYLDDELWHLRQPKESQKGVVRIGYMGGDSHAADIQIILPALKKILQKYSSSIQLVFWGLEPPEEISSNFDVKWFPLNMQDYVQFANYFQEQEFDIFLAPLANTRFNQSKSSIKYLECSALGGVGVCSQIDPYQNIVEDGKTGFLADSMEEWILSLSKLIENPSLRLQMSHQAQKMIREKWLLSDHYQKWTESYQKIINQYQPRDISKSFQIAESIFTQWNQALEQERKVFEHKIVDLENQLTNTWSGTLEKLIKKFR